MKYLKNYCQMCFFFEMTSLHSAPWQPDMKKEWLFRSHISQSTLACNFNSTISQMDIEVIVYFIRFQNYCQSEVMCHIHTRKILEIKIILLSSVMYLYSDSIEQHVRKRLVTNRTLACSVCGKAGRRVFLSFAGMRRHLTFHLPVLPIVSELNSNSGHSAVLPRLFKPPAACHCSSRCKGWTQRNKRTQRELISLSKVTVMATSSYDGLRPASWDM